MMWTRKLTTKAGLKSSVAGFARKEDGSMTIFAVFMFLMMLLVGGIGVDLMRNEMDRTRLQATVDRAVLAAADLDQPLDPDAVVRDYFEKAGMSQYLSSVTVDQGLNFRTVTANASTVTPTQFMRMMGVNELPVPALGQAEERVTDVEISMVLDISGSMGWDSKMANLQTAAKTFVDTVINETNEDLISVSLVPYTAQVNAGWDIFSELNTNHVHNYSYCVDFDVADFSLTGLELSNHTYQQMQHFDQGWNYSNPVSNPGCPKRDFEEIVAFSQDAESLKTTIGQYKARANTAIHLGMKWGVALLDPSFQPITEELNNDNLVDDVFSNRPVEFDDPETLKTIVLMTDGQNVDTQRIQPWYYDSSSEIVHWNRYPLHWYLNNYVSGYWSNWRYTKYTAAQADSMLANICTAAKDQGIVVWSVGFQVNDYSAGVMESCASSPSHFFRVEGVEITEAFEAIAKQINQLRLTQ